ncbi:dephospho-CoA kinase [Chishuiella changwenlii]|uniref:dephospho-CoA kinase n=1 Tax=Chishuiella changwenlii TaxID=1434701 RepID=UPI002FD9A3F0
MKNKQTFIVGITGGIGSGKSTAAHFFEELGIPVYNSDTRAKVIQNEDETVKSKVIQVFGDEAYTKEGLNRAFIAKQIFNNKEKLNALNKIVHPAVFLDFENWKKEQNSKILIKEAAILIESGSYKDCDAVVSVVVDLDKRIERTIARDQSTKEEVLKRINNQISDEERIAKSDFIIDNNADLKHLKNKVEKTYFQLKEKFSL